MAIRLFRARIRGGILIELAPDFDLNRMTTPIKAVRAGIDADPSASIRACRKLLGEVFVPETQLCRGARAVRMVSKEAPAAAIIGTVQERCDLQKLVKTTEQVSYLGGGRPWLPAPLQGNGIRDAIISGVVVYHSRRPFFGGKEEYGCRYTAVDVSGPTRWADLFNLSKAARCSRVSMRVCAGTCPYADVMDHRTAHHCHVAQRNAGEGFSSESLLACVACYACMASAARHPADRGAAPAHQGADLLRLPKLRPSSRKRSRTRCAYGNPMGGVEPQAGGLGQDRRASPSESWPGPQGADVLWFVECYAPITPRGGCQPRHRQALPRAGHGLRDPRQRREVRRGMRPAHLTCSTEASSRSAIPSSPGEHLHRRSIPGRLLPGPKDIPDTVAQAGAAAPKRSC